MGEFKGNFTVTWEAQPLHVQTGTGSVSLDSPYSYPPPQSACELVGHKVDHWAEYLDGECVAKCNVCGERIASARPPGGLPFVRLKALAERLMATPDNILLAVEISEIEILLEAEEIALREAYALLDTARKMSECGKL